MPISHAGAQVGLALFILAVAPACSSNGMTTGSSRGSCVSGPCIDQESGSGGSIPGGAPSGAGGVPGAGAAGSPGYGGAPPPPDSSTCVPSPRSADDPRDKRPCADDGDCPTDKFCNQDVGISGVCDCVDGRQQCYEYFTYFCDAYATSCRHASASFTSQLTGDSCTVMVRTDTDGSQIKGYASLCGPLKPMTAEQALIELRTMSSIYWGRATLVDDGAQTGIIAYATSDQYFAYAAYFSANTGQMLLLLRKAIDPSMTTSLSQDTWGPAADLGTSCAFGEQVSTFGTGGGISSFMIGSAQDFTWPALHLVFGTDIYRSLRQAVQPSLKQGVASIAAPTPELYFFITSP